MQASSLDFQLQKLLSKTYSHWLLFEPEAKKFIHDKLASIDPSLAHHFDILLEPLNACRGENKLLDIMTEPVEMTSTETVTQSDATLLDKLSIQDTPMEIASESHALDIKKEHHLQETLVTKEDSQVTLRDDSSSDAMNEDLKETEILKSETKMDKIPTFYRAYGSACHSAESCAEIIAQVHQIYQEKQKTEEDFKGLAETDFKAVANICKVPLYLSRSLFRKCLIPNDGEEELVSFDTFKSVWERMYLKFVNEEALAFAILKKENASFIVPGDVDIVAEFVVQTHPGLEFLSTMPNFQAKYVETVTSRIFYEKRRNWTNQMTFVEFKDCNLLNMIKALESVEDMNSTRDAFSYKHFYVIYCKFWELDANNDMLIDEMALQVFEHGALTSRIINRVIQGCGQGRRVEKPNFMTYREFIPFIISCEDKKSTHAIEYWFRCLDLDGDGVLSLHELRYFWEEQFERMLESRMSDPWKFEDFICSLFDLIQPEKSNVVTLRDLKRCGSPSLFFDMIFDLRKYDHQIRRIDPLYREMDDLTILDVTGERIALEGWNKYAHRAYEELSSDESQQQESAVVVSEFDEFMDPHDDFLWSDREDFEEMRIESASDEEEDEKMDVINEVPLTDSSEEKDCNVEPPKVLIASEDDSN